MEYMAQDLEDLSEKYPFVERLTDDVQGSGINGDWDGKETKDYIRLYNSFDVRNDMGYFVGSADFTVLIPKKKPMNFKIQWGGNAARSLAKRYLLKEYLDDTLADGMRIALKRYPLKMTKKRAIKSIRRR